MSKKPQSRGKCAYCGKEYAKGSMTRHLKSCTARQEAMAAAQKKRGRDITLYHIQVLDKTPWAVFDSAYFWLHLEVAGNATLQDLDEYLRAIWLECCGHLSGFEIGEVFYTQIFDDGMSWRLERNMNVRIDRLFQPGMKIPYQYDFGTTSYLTIRVLDQRQGKPIHGKPIDLMARNNPLEIACHVCGKPAEWICTQCMWEEGKDSAFCEEHAEEHEHEEMELPILNSPRTGLCAYSGPDTPPY